MKAFNTYMFQQNVSLTIHNTTDDKKFFAVVCCLIINERIFVNITKHKDKKQEKKDCFFILRISCKSDILRTRIRIGIAIIYIAR